MRNDKQHKTCNDCVRKKSTLRECHKHAESKGGECLSKSYKNNSIKMKWRCSEGHEWDSRWQSIRENHWCGICVVKKNGLKKRLTIEECHEVAKKKGGKCLSTEYVNDRTKMKWRCSEGHEWDANFNKIKHETWCKICHINSLKSDIDVCNELAKKKGGECLSTKYINNKTKMKWKCKDGHEWMASIDIIQNQDAWCKKCYSITQSLDINVCREFAKKKGGILIGNYVNSYSKTKWECNKGHIINDSYEKIRNRAFLCKICNNENLNILKLKYCKEFAIKKGGECLSIKYTGIFDHMNWRCSNDHEWSADYHNIKSGKWCPTCARGRSEEMSREIIQRLTKKKFISCRPKWLNGLELDGYCEELNMAFEYNGEQHYKFIKHWHKTEDGLKRQQERDRRKYRICAEQDIKLIIIPYKFNCYSPDKLECFITDILVSFKCVLPFQYHGV